MAAPIGWRGCWSPPLAKNPGCGGKGSTRIHPRKSAKSTALQQKTKNPKNPGLVQRAGFWQAYHAGVISGALGPFRAVAGCLDPCHHSCVICRALAAPEKGGGFLGFLGSLCAAGDLGKKPPWMLWDSLGSGVDSCPLHHASVMRWLLFVASRPHPSSRSAHRAKKRLDSPNQPSSPPLITRGRFPHP
jgi:hypothetical protein